MKTLCLKNLILLVWFSFINQQIFSQTFVEQTGIILPGISSGSTTWGDYDNDGDLDLLISGSSSTGTSILKVFRNDGSSTFVDLGSVFSPVNYGYVAYGDDFRSAWADFDSDGYLDVITNGNNPNGGYNLIVYKNNGNSTFTLKYTYSFITFQGGSAFDCADYDNDGDIDIVVTTSTAPKVLNNQGSYVFFGATYNQIAGR